MTTLVQQTEIDIDHFAKELGITATEIIDNAIETQEQRDSLRVILKAAAWCKPKTRKDMFAHLSRWDRIAKMGGADA